MCSLPRRCRLLLSLIALAAPLAAVPAGAQSGDRSRSAEALLVRQDNSDCGNSDVRADDPSRIGGTVLITREADGKWRVKVAITAAPDTTYHFFLKCVRSLGDIKTEDEGEAVAEFELAADGAPAVLTFDMYPEGAPSGQKFQSTPVRLP
ncbi:hypothetical protein SSBR45G_17180 [Bradyrhizobium sp. SSBR45G]|uniref:hypothetical protein n=1 Tax=unclassified Bradyrhizobium TaxID=2631580 RepID=UPI002342A60A|nr:MULTISPECIES: hypothetical protein [unclassified Bradyrhizobium]GLH76810.1 hypothetical protein SSBR45G_17180 [Bradyrhizobium sp. SSBR45G]GLH83568.1 hypothetical protein SSBR45R_10280 [Bradyrhizobium sp. SSBR45R]